MEAAMSPLYAKKALLGSPAVDLEAALQDAMGVKAQAVVSNRLTRREMDSLTAIGDTLLPSIDVTATTDQDESVRCFYQTSASMLGTHEASGEYLAKLRHAMQGLLRLTLWMLSTWIGTFFVCGAMNVSSRFPYVHKFSDLDPERRERIVLWWANNPCYLYRELFRGVKSVVALTYFTQVNEKQENPTWKALGYCGPDPEHIKKQLESADDEGSCSERLGPLHRAVVYMQDPKDTLYSTLSQAGLSLITTRPPPRHKCPYIAKTPQNKPITTIQCDAVIVGSGSGGGVVAGVLAQAGYKVIVLEKGNYNARSNLTLLEGHTVKSMYECNGLLATDDTGVMILAGSTVGGGSAINWSASIRTPDHVISEWRNQHELELFGSDAYEAALRTVCDRMGVQSEFNEENLNNSVLRRGCTELGYPVKNIPRNSTADHYCGWCCFGCRDGRKKGTLETWLVDMAESGNGVILPGCQAIKVLHEDRGRKRNVATGVVFEYDNHWSGEKETCIIESKVTVAACGALNTPVLLKRSGLRNANIGKNLHLHPVVMAGDTSPQQLPRRQKLARRLATKGAS
ncbi:long-chain-alcohol oxidase FAO4A-like [Iris pallida]|uniref:Long-chain-alcohol oxidase n=1 Tax=Iris pallida TaxID=29817 RepID=A0AAX6FD40_IRIPA|nr:long-chain-alcohol oxidase FAO4A-like [Iris pallida]